MRGDRTPHNAAPAPSGSLPALILLLALCVGAAFFVDRAVLPDLFPRRLAEVVPGKIYRGSELTPAALESLTRRSRLRSIIDLGIAPDGSPRDLRQQSAAAALGLTRYKFHLIGDSTGNPNEYVAALRIALRPENQPVLIHCATGSQRTSCAIALLRMASENAPIEEALAEATRFDARTKVDEVVRSIAPQVLAALRRGDWIPGFPIPDVRPTGPAQGSAGQHSQAVRTR
jgi:protein tyrosine phosphatase (PTP) superfamily phosphohydrolase (DUF442 family)